MIQNPQQIQSKRNSEWIIGIIASKFGNCGHLHASKVTGNFACCLDRLDTYSPFRDCCPKTLQNFCRGDYLHWLGNVWNLLFNAVNLCTFSMPSCKRTCVPVFIHLTNFLNENSATALVLSTQWERMFVHRRGFSCIFTTALLFTSRLAIFPPVVGKSQPQPQSPAVKKLSTMRRNNWRISSMAML